MKRIAISLITAFLVGAFTQLSAQCTVQAFADPAKIFCGQTVTPYAVGVTPTYVTLYSNDFNGSTLGSGWKTNINVQFNNPCNAESPGDGTPHLWMGSNATIPREIETVPYDLSLGGEVCFDMRYAKTNSSGVASCESPDLPGEGVYIEYSSNGTSWFTLDYVQPTVNGNGDNIAPTLNWKKYCYNLPLNALTSTTRFRWSQKSTTGAGVDHWGLDNVEIKLNDPNYKYNWSHSAVKTANPGPDVPVNTTTYTVTYKDQVSGDQCQSSVNVQVVKPSVTASANPTTICPGNTSQLNAVPTLPGINRVPTSCGLAVSGFCDPAFEQEVTKTVGNGTASSTSFGRGILNGWWDPTRRTQILYRAADIGSVGGKIKSLSFDFVSFGDASARSAQAFSISIKCVGKNQFNTSGTEALDLGGFSTVFGPKNISGLVVGWNEFVFDQPYDWDGTSNLIVEICFTNPTTTEDAAVRDQDVGYPCYKYWSEAFDGDDVCGMTSSSNNFPDDYRPNARFKICEPKPIQFTYKWTPTATLNNGNIKNPVASPTATTTYTVEVNISGSPAACAQTDNVTVNVANVNSFTPSYNNPVCEGEDIKLNAGIPGMTTYSWTGPGGYTSNQANPTRAGATVAMAGTYTVTVSNGTCSGTQSVDVAVGIQPVPGGTYSDDICESETAYALEGNLVPPFDAGGVWTAVGATNGAPGLSGKTVNANNLPDAPETYTYRRSVTNACGTRSVDITLNVEKQPLAGGDKTTVVCQSSGVNTLFDKLGKDANGKSAETGGVWTDLSGVGGAFNAAAGEVDVSGLAAGMYDFRYTQTAVAPCVNASAVVTLNVIANPNTGGSDTVQICGDNKNSLDLFTALTGTPDAGGNWVVLSPLTGGATLSPAGIFDPADANPGIVRFRYEITTPGCPQSSTEIGVEVVKPNTPGGDKTTVVCNSSSVITLFDKLGKDGKGRNADPNGTWQDLSGVGAAFDPVAGTVNVNGFTPGTYDFQYEVPVNGPCPASTAVVTLDVLANPVTGNPDTVKVCADGSSTVDLFTAIAGAYDMGGTWTAQSPLLGGATLTDNVYNPKNAPKNRYIFKYEINTPGCPVTSTNVAVEVENLPNPGVGQDASVCDVTGVINLRNYLTNSPATGGVWTEITTIADTNFDATAGTVDVTNLGGSVLEFQYEVAGIDPCPAQNTSFVLTVLSNPTAGPDVVDTICTDLSNVDLNDFLDASAALGGNWVENTSSGGTLDPSGFYNSLNVAEGEYVFQYTTNPPAGCPTDDSELKLYVRGFPIFSQVAPPQCSQDRTTFDVELTVSGGDAGSYSVNQPGAFISNPPNVFVSDPITSGASVVFEVTDQYGCGTGDATVTRDCDCKTDAGQLDVSPQSLCDAITANFNYLGGFTNDSNDTYQFVIFDAAVGLSSIIERSKTPNFTFDLAKGYVFNKEYAVAVIAGDSTSAGDVILTDACLSVSQTAKVTWHPLPDVTVSASPLVICPGDTTVFTFTYNVGDAPFAAAYTYNGVNDTIKNLTLAANTFKSPELTADITYSFVSVKDKFGCTSPMTEVIAIDVNESSSVVLSGMDSICLDASSTASMTVDITGPGSQYEVRYTNLLTNNQTTVTGLPGGNNVNISGLVGDVNAAVSYRLDTVIGNVPSICPAFTSGIFTINPIPTAVITPTPASNTFCEDDANVLFDINLTGIGPWELTIPTNGLGVEEKLTINQRNNSAVLLDMPAPGSYTYTVSIVDLGSTLSCTGNDVSVSFTVNNKPEITGAFDLPDAVVCEDNTPQVVNFTYNQGSVEDYEISGFTIMAGGSSSTVDVSRTSGGTFSIPQPMAPGNYILSGTVREKNAPNCVGTFNSDAITVKELPSVTHNRNYPNNTDTVCLGNDAILTFDLTADVNVDPANGVNFDLVGTDGSNQAITGETPGLLTVTIRPLQPGTVTYDIRNVTDNAGTLICSGAESQFTIVVLDAPEMQLTDNAIEVCEGTPVVIPFDVSGTGLISGVLKEVNGQVSDVTLSEIAGTGFSTQLNLNPGTYQFAIENVQDNTVAACPGANSTQLTDVVVRALPVGDFDVTAEVCEGNQINLKLKVPANGNGPFTFTVSGWNIDGSDAVFTNVTATSNNSYNTILPPPGGTITLTKVEDSSNPDGPAVNCFVDSNIPVQYVVNELPRINLFGEDNICEGETPVLTMDVTSGVGSTYSVVIETFPAVADEVYFETVVPGSNEVPLNPAPTQSRYYTIASIQDDLTGCINIYPSSPDAYVTVNPLPQVDFIADIQQSCPPLVMVYEPFVSAPGGIQSVVWDFGDGTTTADRDTVTKTYAYTGLYSPSLTATTISGCVRTVMKEEYAEVFSMPIPTFSLKENRLSVFSPVIQVDNNTSNAVRYNWDFGGYGSSTEFEPEFLLIDLENGFADVCLEAISSNGCVDTTCQIVEVVGEVIINVPNTFTPDGDGINDGFKPVFRGALPNAYEMVIFDRWGTEIFSTRNPDAAWYGLGKNGGMVKDGVYVYRIELKSRYSAEKVVKVGNINLFR